MALISTSRLVFQNCRLRCFHQGLNWQTSMCRSVCQLNSPKTRLVVYDKKDEVSFVFSRYSKCFRYKTTMCNSSVVSADKKLLAGKIFTYTFFRISNSLFTKNTRWISCIKVSFSTALIRLYSFNEKHDRPVCQELKLVKIFHNM